MMHRLYALLAAAVVLCPMAASAQTRHEEAHMHGTGQLLVAIDGTAVSLELTVPAADIVGFEREPADAAERAGVDGALATLAEPLTLFSFSPDAGCAVTSSAAHFGDEGEHEAEPHAHEEHADFAAPYLLDCSQLNGGQLELETQFFTLFESAEALVIEGLVDGSPVQAALSRQEPSARLR